MTFARKRPVLACPRGDEKNPIGRALPSPCWCDRCGFLLSAVRQHLGEFRSLHLSLLSLSVCVLFFPRPPF